MANKNNNKILKSESVERRTFSYKLGAVALEFTLRTDIKQELKDFKECMLMGIKDIDAQLGKK